MKDIPTIEYRIKALSFNLKTIKDKQSAARMQGYINALKWVLSHHDDKGEEKIKMVKKQWR